MPGSPQPTRLSPITKQVVGAAVIEFHTPPRYRQCEVDLTHNRLVEYLGPGTREGNIVAGPRVVVPNITQVSGTCQVLAEPAEYTIRSSYTGLVSIGVEEV